MYTWDNIKQSVLAKMNLSESEASAMNLPQRYPVYANEAMTQICNAIRPKEMWKEFVVVSEQDANNGVEHDAVVGAEVHLPDDFISFSDNIPLVKRDDGSWDEVYDEYLLYYGFDTVFFVMPGVYRLPYKARWYFFTADMNSAEKSNVKLPIPDIICEAISTYIVSQCYKIDDELKAATYKNEYEMQLARIDASDFNRQRTFNIGGGW